MIPNRIEFKLKSEVSKSFRCIMAANALDIDTDSKSIHHFVVDNIQIPDNWNIGVIYGASGSGKTTLIKHLFGEDVFKTVLDENKSILDQLPEKYEYKDCSSILTGMGLNSVPCWIRPIKTLSNGQKARAEAAILMTSSDGIVCIDEWTSVVDRTVAKAMSFCLQKYIKNNNKQVILLTCHYDILEWVKPDWLIDCNKQEFVLPNSNDFFFREREKLEFNVWEIGRDEAKKQWKSLSKYHYLSDRLPTGLGYFFVLECNGDVIGFQSYINVVPCNKKHGRRKILHGSRLVIHPDYTGFGLSLGFVESAGNILIDRGFRVMYKFTSIPLKKAWTSHLNLFT